MTTIHPQLNQCKNILNDLIGFDTTSSKSNLALIEYLANRLNDLGANIDYSYDNDKQKANIFATLGENTQDGIVLSGHTDVVPVQGQNWHSDPFIALEKDDKIFGRGSCDMKGFIAASIATAHEFKAKKHTKPIHYAFSFDEEVGCLGAEILVQQLKQKHIQPKMTFIGEPTEMKIIDGHKGCYEFNTCFHGLAGHSSLPDIGVNSIHFASLFVQKIIQLSNELQKRAGADSPYNPPWTTLLASVIHGGVAHNVIPDTCTVGWQYRSINKQDSQYIEKTLDEYCQKYLLPEMQKVSPDAKIITEAIGMAAGLEVVEENQAKKIMQHLLNDDTSDVVSFGTEGGFFQQINCDVVVCGPGSIEQAHKADEFVAIEQLNKSLHTLTDLNQYLAK